MRYDAVEANVTECVHEPYCGRVWMGYSPVVLLILVALVQMLSAVGSQHLTPSKGGGFGMFATVDSLKTRLMRIYLVDAAGRSRPIRLPSHTWARTLRHARALPTRQRLRHLAHQVAQIYPHTAAVRIAVWKRVFDASQPQVRAVKLQELTWERSREISR